MPSSACRHLSVHLSAMLRPPITTLASATAELVSQSNGNLQQHASTERPRAFALQNAKRLLIGGSSITVRWTQSRGCLKQCYDNTRSSILLCCALWCTTNNGGLSRTPDSTETRAHCTQMWTQKITRLSQVIPLDATSWCSQTQQ